MDLIETINAVVDLQKRVYKLSANTNLNSQGQQIINDYNALASRVSGKQYALLDQTAVLTPYLVDMGLVSISTRISTDDFDLMKDGMSSLFDALAAAIRLECSRRVRAVEQRVLEPAVKMLLDDIKMKKQYSEITLANILANDTAKLDNIIDKIENPLNPGIVDDVTYRPNFTQRGGGIRYTTGRWAGTRGAVTCVSGTDGEHVINIPLKTQMNGILSVMYIPAPGKISQSIGRANGVPVALKCTDVSPDMTRNDITIEFVKSGVLIGTQRGTGAFQFKQANHIRIRVEPWNNAKNRNPNPDFTNWNQNQANSQPTVSIMFEVMSAYAQVENDILASTDTKVQYYLDTHFTDDSFIRRPNINWTVLDMLSTQNDSIWAKKIAASVAAFSSKI
uniref:VP6 n=1 Tax=Rotavirus G TaxID=183407 RepID=A0A345ANN9_9REOV|nr:VP6 [Rotavirus G]